MGKTARRTALVVVLAVMALAAAATQAQAVTPPTVATGSASSVTQTSATLNAIVNPNGGEVTDASSNTAPRPPTDQVRRARPRRGPGSSPVEVSASVTGLIRKPNLPLQGLGDQRDRYQRRRRPENSKRCRTPRQSSQKRP